MRSDLPAKVRAASVTCVAIATFTLAAGCRNADEAPSAEQPMAPASVSVAALPDLTGIWTVTGHHIPGISAMSDADAAARHGSTLRLTADEALSGGHRCVEPVYTAESVVTDRFLATEFRLPPGGLAPLASAERITVLEVACAGASWTAPGARLIGIDAARALAPWDGVFFELARDRDFRAVGQEPFWHLEIHKGKQLRFTYDLGEREAVTPAPQPEIDPAKGARVYHAVTEANDLRVAIEPAPCSDVMSGKPFETTVTVTLNGQTYHGCGESLQ